MMKIKIIFIFSLAFLSMLFIACNDHYVSKKTGYFKIDFPEHQYEKFEKSGVPYSFEYPTYAKIVQDSTYFDDTPENPFWYNIDFPDFDARIFLSYKIIGGRAIIKVRDKNGELKDSSGINKYDQMIADAFNLTNKNESVATSIKDSLFRTENGVTGVMFTVGGNAATARQFFMTDTSKNFIRGALYFNASPNADSIKPVLQFLNKDIDHLIKTFQWK